MKRVWLVVLIWVSVLLLAGCNAKSGTAADAPAGDVVPVVSKKDADSVIAEGVIVPARSSYLGFEIPGDVVEILVKTGDQVQAGDPLVRLDTRELALSLQSAEQDVVAQDAVLQQLLNGASEKVIARADKANHDQIAQAEVALLAKQLQLEKLRAEDPAIGVAAAQARVDQLQLQLTQARAQDPAPAVAIAQVGLERARIALADVQDEYNKSLDRPWEDQEIRDAWAKQLEQVQLDYQLAQAQLENALNNKTAYGVGLSIMAAQIEEAKTQLAQSLVAQQSYSTTLDILAADVEAARLQLDALETWDNPYRDDPSAEEIAQLEVMVQKAKIGVETLRLAMEDAELTAPFAGIVVDVQVEVGDQVSPGQVMVVLATLGKLEIHTTDLTELDVAQVAVGQPVEVSVDALPGLKFVGRVDEIALQGQDYRGDVVYQVTVTLDNGQEMGALRWGMTTMVEINTR
ncbi:MAG: efflux RND transporter periplasmic adaptor subunit [Anaerolineae bacterium]|nr:efflux RND transporter periplasmic adaptor subunit [Anaerolineae bacterium]